MRGAVEDGHVGTQLGEQRSGQGAFDPGDLFEQSMLDCVGLELLIDAGIELGDIAVGVIETSKLQTQNEAMVLLERRGRSV